MRRHPSSQKEGVLLQGHAIWIEERWDDVPEVDHQYVHRLNRDTMEVYIDDMLVKKLKAADHITHLEKPSRSCANMI